MLICGMVFLLTTWLFAVSQFGQMKIVGLIALLICWTLGGLSIRGFWRAKRYCDEHPIDLQFGIGKQVETDGSKNPVLVLQVENYTNTPVAFTTYELVEAGSKSPLFTFLKSHGHLTESALSKEQQRLCTVRLDLWIPDLIKRGLVGKLELIGVAQAENGNRYESPPFVLDVEKYRWALGL